MPDATGPAASALAEAKRIADGLQFACRIPDKVPDFTACGGPAAEAYWRYFTPARIVSLLAAIEAPLKLHQGITDGDYPESLPICEEDGEFSPCPTVRAITAALAGKEPGDAPA